MAWQCTGCGQIVMDGMIHGCLNVSSNVAATPVIPPLPDAVVIDVPGNVQPQDTVSAALSAGDGTA